MTNVIQFPNKTDMPNTTDEAQQRLHDVRSQYVTDVLEDVTERLFNDIGQYVSLKGEGSYQKDIYFVINSIEALLARYARIDHFMHEVIDNSVSLESEKEEEDEDDNSAPSKDNTNMSGGSKLTVKETLV